MNKTKKLNKNKTKKLNKNTTKNLFTYALVVVAFVVLSILSSQNIIGRQAKGLLIPA